MSDEADFSQLADDLSPEDLRSVLAVFAADVKRLTGNLSAAVVTGDADGFRRVAHGLAGAAGAVGATALEQACRGVMHRHDLDAADLPDLDASIARLAERSLAHLSSFLAALDAAEGAPG